MGAPREERKNELLASLDKERQETLDSKLSLITHERSQSVAEIRGRILSARTNERMQAVSEWWNSVIAAANLAADKLITACFELGITDVDIIARFVSADLEQFIKASAASMSATLSRGHSGAVWARDMQRRMVLASTMAGQIPHRVRSRKYDFAQQQRSNPATVSGESQMDARPEFAASITRFKADISLSSTRVHVLVITATPDELEGFKAIKNGADGGWEERQDSAGFRYHVREFTRANGGIIRVAVVRPVDMKAVPASNVATRLVTELKPVCLAMSGICAGRRGEVCLGDVVVASCLFDAEAGKLKAITNEDGDRDEEMLHEITTYNLDPRWQHRTQDWPRVWCDRWQAERPRTVAYQENWLLDTLHRHEEKQGERPETHPERHTQCSSWKDIILRLRKRGLLTETGLALTGAGRAYVEEQWLLHHGRMPDEKPLRVHVGPMATVPNVMQDPALFGRLLKLHRKVLAVDMESVAIGLVATLEQVPYTLVVKAVQDYADHDKDDSLRHFGARVAAAFLLDFLRENLPADMLEPPTSQEDLSSGQATLASLATLAEPFAGSNPDQAIVNNLIEAMSQCLHLDEWERFADGAYYHQITKRVMQNQSRLKNILHGTIFPPSLPRLTMATREVIDAYVAYVDHFLTRATPHLGGEYLIEDRSYKGHYLNPRYDEEVAASNLWKEHSLLLFHRLVVKINAFCDVVRECVKPSYYLTKGRFLVIEDDDSYMPDADEVEEKLKDK